MKCFGKINSQLKLPADILNEIDFDNLTDFADSDEKDEETESDSEENQTILNNQEIDELVMSDEANRSLLNELTHIVNPTSNRVSNIVPNMSHEDGSNVNTGNANAANQALSRVEFIRLTAQTINKNYNGDPLSLNAFVNAINLAKEMSAGTHNDILKTFILTKLEAKALECVDPNGTVDDIINDLKNNIKPDSSKVVSGRMLALKLNKLTTQEYAIKAEELAEAFQRSLVIEGIKRDKAKEMAIDKTVEMCRQSAKNDLVRSVLAAAHFKDPKEAIAKLITEQVTNDTERQVLHFNQQNGRYNNKNKSNFKYNKFNNSNNNGNNNRYNNNGNRNWRNNSNNRGNRYNNNRNNNRGNDYNVRVAENAPAPSERRGTAQDQQAAVFTLERVNRN